MLSSVNQLEYQKESILRHSISFNCVTMVNIDGVVTDRIHPESWSSLEISACHSLAQARLSERCD